MMEWVAITLVGISHLYCGYLFAIWFLPSEIATGKTIRLKNGVAAGFALMWIAGVSLLLATHGAQITDTQAYIVGGCTFASFLFYRGYFAATEPKGPWDQCLNKQFQVSMDICRRHGWATESQAVIHKLGNEKRLHFDGGDYDLLLQIQSDQTRSLNAQHTPMLPNGEIDYNLACAREIAMRSKAIFGSEHLEGILTQVADETDASKLDRAAMDLFRWLGEAIEKQWGTECLW